MITGEDDRQADLKAKTARSERGFALVLVIAVLSVLALLAAAIAAQTRSTAVAAHARIQFVETRNLADAGVTLAIMHLLDPNEATRWRADGAMHQEQYDGANIAITIDDEAGKVDLNNAPEELLVGLLSEFTGGDQANLVANQILQRRADFGSIPQESSRYYKAGLISFQGLHRLPFADISELRLLPGVNPDLYERIAPFVTVYSRSPTLNRQTASRTALLAIPNITPTDVDALIVSRGTNEQLGATQLSAFARYTRLSSVQAVTIRAKAVLPADTSFTREAVVAITPNQPLEPPGFLRWRQAVENENTGGAQ